MTTFSTELTGKRIELLKDGSESRTSGAASQYGKSGCPTRMGRDQDGGATLDLRAELLDVRDQDDIAAHSSWQSDSMSTRFSSGQTGSPKCINK